MKDSSKGLPQYYLGNNYKKDKKGRWCIGCKKYLTEAVHRIEAILSKSLPKKDTPIPDGDHLEEDSCALLNDDEHRKNQMLIGILNWIVEIGRMDVAFAIVSLSRFTVAPRKGYWDIAIQIFCYLKKCKNRRFIIDSRDLILIRGKDTLSLDFKVFLCEKYPDAVEDIDSKIPILMIDELEITAFVDSDHTHEKVTRKSINGLFILVSITLVYL